MKKTSISTDEKVNPFLAEKETYVFTAKHRYGMSRFVLFQTAQSVTTEIESLKKDCKSSKSL